MRSALRALSLVLLALLAGSAEAQQDTGPYIQVSPTPSKLSVGGPGFVQIDANGIASIATAAPGSGTVTNSSGALLLNHMVVGNGGADIKTLGGTVGGAFTTAGAFTTTGAVSGVTLAFPSGGPFTYTFPLATATLASLAGSETFTNKIYNGGQLSGSFSGNPTFLGIPLFTNLSTGTQTVCLGLDSTFHLVTSAGACGSGGGGISGLTAGQVPLAGSATTLTSSFALGTGIQTALGVNVGSAGAPVLFNGAGGTPSSLGLANATGLPVAGGGTGASTAAGARTNLGVGTTASTTNTLAGDGAGNAVAVTGTGTNCVLVNGTSGACGGGGAAGSGVDGGTSAQSVTAGGTVNNGARLVKIASGWASGTLTLPVISAVSADTEICFVDAGNFVDATHTVSIAPNAANTINTSTSAIGPFTVAGFSVCVRVSATLNWTVQSDEQSTIIQSVTGTGTLNASTRLVKIASGWATGTLTLPAISAGMYDVCIRFNDGGNFVDGTHTLTIKGGVSDGLNGGAANGTLGPFTVQGTFLLACVSGANNWNVGPGSVGAQAATSNNFLTGIDATGLFTRAQPSVSNISGFGTGVATALGVNLSATGGLTKTVFSGAKALATGAISSAACTSAQTDTATGTLTTDVVLASFNGDPTAVTGYVPLTTGMLTIIAYPTADTVNFKVCNNTNASVTPGAITLNWRVVR